MGGAIMVTRAGRWWHKWVIRPRRRNLISRIGATFAIGFAMLLTGCDQAEPRLDREIRIDAAAEMKAAVEQRDWPRAERFATQAMIERPDDPDLVTTAAGIAAFQGNKQQAATLLVDAARLADYRPASRVNHAVQALIDVGEVYPAIELLESSLREHPEEDTHRRMLVGFLGEVQRRDLIPPHLRKLIVNRSFDVKLLVATLESSTRRFSQDTAEKMLERNSDDLRVRLVDAFLHMYRRNAEAAAEVLEEILQRHPDFAPAHAMYGQALVASARWSELEEWQRRRPPGSERFADYWLTLGDVASANDRPAEATRAYWEATRREADRREAWDRLRYSMQRLHDESGDIGELGTDITEQSIELIATHNDRLLELSERFNDFEADDRRSQSKAVKVAELLASVGRVWEAEAWSAVATTLTSEPTPELQKVRKEILMRLNGDTAWVAKDTPVLRIDLSDLPLPESSLLEDGDDPRQLVPNLLTTDHLAMSEQTVAWGLASIGAGNSPGDAGLAPLIRSTGVGGGAIDYDLDGWSDLLMMNAGGTMLEKNSMANVLLRNIGEKFVPAAEQAGVGDTGFGQGVAVGDYNEDGFADLFFANLGVNLLLRNNGDGTFSDVTAERLRGDRGDHWSTSAAFVDIDGDAIADLVATSYCRTVDNLGEPCPNEQGVLGPCHPLLYPAESDQFFRGSARGILENVTADWVEESAVGRGLGVVAGALDGGRLAIFVANDMSRNNLYMWESTENGGRRLVDSAAARGVAVDGRSLPQASMGIAASDLDLDGDLDLYVTGFGREYNVYYEQVSAGLWKDSTSQLDLVQPTLEVIGFGTQAIDLENDGLEELIVTNGHIGEFSTPGAPPYEQPLQIFRRGADGRFDLLDCDDWGDYFRNSHVGRTLWTSDVNRDGLKDVFITHSNEQIELLINETRNDNHVLGFRLVATESSRDAVGAVIRFEVDGQPRTLWQLSGDGYFCSNEKVLMAGTGKAEEVTGVTVTWQDGSVDQLGRLAADTQYLIVQGIGEAFQLSEYDKPRR